MTDREMGADCSPTAFGGGLVGRYFGGGVFTLCCQQDGAEALGMRIVSNHLAVVVFDGAVVRPLKTDR